MSGLFRKSREGSARLFNRTPQARAFPCRQNARACGVRLNDLKANREVISKHIDTSLQSPGMIFPFRNSRQRSTHEWTVAIDSHFLNEVSD